MSVIRARIYQLVFYLVVAIAATAGYAQQFPSHPIHIVVPVPPGGGVDASARLVGQKIGDRLGTTVVIDNRPGANGLIGTEAVARAAPDGYTLIMVSMSHAINPSFYPKIPYDSVKDFAPVSLVVTAPGLLVVGPSLKVRTVREFIEAAKSRPGQITVSSGGNGSPGHLALELMKKIAGIDVIHVPYKGGGDVMTDVIGGRVDATIPGIASALPMVKAGKATALAVTSSRRAATAPDVPTMAEAGLPGYEAASWYALLAPAGTPREIVDTLSRETAQALKVNEVRERLIAQGLDPAASTPAELSKKIVDEIDKWHRLIQSAGIKND